MYRLIAVALLVVLTACMDTKTTQISFRDAATPMYAMASLDLAQFSGRWQEVSAYLPDGASCVTGAMTFSRQKNNDLTLAQGPCSDGTPQRGLARRLGPGRFAFAGDEIWVLWVDFEYSVAAIGTASGQAYVLARSLHAPADKIAAAKDILAWNGFDVSSLKPARRK